MYKLVHDADYPCEIIVRQEGQDLAFHFPQTCQVFKISEGTSVLSMINPDVALLFGRTSCLSGGTPFNRYKNSYYMFTRSKMVQGV